MPLKRILPLFALAAALQGCYKNAGCWKNEKIDASVRSELHGLTDQMITDLKTDNLEALKAIESKRVIEQSAGAARRLDLIGNALKKSDYKVLDEYYVVNKFKNRDTIVNGSRGVNSYSIYYPGTTHEMYLAYLIPKTGNNKWMITVEFCKFKYGWKLNNLYQSLYAVNGKTGPELYELAEQELKKGYLINASNLIQLATSCNYPGLFLSYYKADSIEQANDTIGREMVKKFNSAIVLNTIPTHPKLIKMFNGEFNDGYYPMIYYQTSINLNDTVAVRKENNAIMQELPKIMPGIDKDTPWLLFKAFNKLPNAQENVPRYEMDNRIGK